MKPVASDTLVLQMRSAKVARQNWSINALQNVQENKTDVIPGGGTLLVKWELLFDIVSTTAHKYW